MQYKQDLTHFYYIDPTHMQMTNMFFMESIISLKDNIWDVFDVTERDKGMFEHGYT